MCVSTRTMGKMPMLLKDRRRRIRQGRDALLRALELIVVEVELRGQRGRDRLPMGSSTKPDALRAAERVGDLHDLRDQAHLLFGLGATVMEAGRGATRGRKAPRGREGQSQPLVVDADQVSLDLAEVPRVFLGGVAYGREFLRHQL